MDKKGPRVLMISTDRNILSQGSSVSQRMREYGELVESLHIILLSDKKHDLKETRLSNGVLVSPTNSLNKFLRPLDAVRIGKKINCDLVTTQDPFECGFVGMKLKKLGNIPLEVQLHTDMFSPHFSGFLNLIRKQMAKKVFVSADAVRVVRSKLKGKIVERFCIDEKKVSVLPIHIDLTRISGEPKFNLHEKYNSKYILLTVSRLSKEKNLPTIIKAMLQVDEAVLVIIGSGPEEYSLRKLVNELELDRKIKFEGWQEDLSSYYKTADILVQASSFEGYGLSIVEAGVCGLAVISTPTGVAEDFDEIAKAENVETFAKKINYLLSHKSERINLGNNLKKVLENGIYTKSAYLGKIQENWKKIAIN